MLPNCYQLLSHQFQPVSLPTQPEFMETLKLMAWKEPPPTSFQEMFDEQGLANLQEHQALNSKFQTPEQIQYQLNALTTAIPLSRCRSHASMHATVSTGSLAF